MDTKETGVADQDGDRAQLEPKNVEELLEPYQRAFPDADSTLMDFVVASAGHYKVVEKSEDRVILVLMILLSIGTAIGAWLLGFRYSLIIIIPIGSLVCALISLPISGLLNKVFLASAFRERGERVRKLDEFDREELEAALANLEESRFAPIRYGVYGIASELDISRADVRRFRKNTSQLLDDIRELFFEPHLVKLEALRLESTTHSSDGEPVTTSEVSSSVTTRALDSDTLVVRLSGILGELEGVAWQGLTPEDRFLILHEFYIAVEDRLHLASDFPEASDAVVAMFDQAEARLGDVDKEKLPSLLTREQKREKSARIWVPVNIILALAMLAWTFVLSRQVEAIGSFVYDNYAVIGIGAGLPLAVIILSIQSAFAMKRGELVEERTIVFTTTTVRTTGHEAKSRAGCRLGGASFLMIVGYLTLAIWFLATLD